MLKELVSILRGRLSKDPLAMFVIKQTFPPKYTVELCQPKKHSPKVDKKPLEFNSYNNQLEE